MLKNFHVAPKRSITICNSAHPVVPFLGSMLLKRIPSKNEMYEDLFYVVVKSNAGEKVMTYREEKVGTDTIQLHNKTLEEFKATVEAGEPLASSYELVNIDSKNKWIGNDIQLYLSQEELI